ncbi:hypothetical protein [Nitrososphaera viennensis]|uniref:Uncharacterized protein n=1 Tax=Nitrososphaera viennensis TaxID=1034015 RepID=A0A977NLX8_9ARCH|nr:hypothetical protein [Nitrososphaera viennensis]UVS68811.1 hypothetical protein NWT39_13000 [Nitrososphaera viennensis]
MPVSVAPATITVFVAAVAVALPSDRMFSAISCHMQVPAFLASAVHDSPCTSSLQSVSSGSNGSAFPARTSIVRSDTSIPSTWHLPRTRTVAGPLTICTAPAAIQLT